MISHLHSQFLHKPISHINHHKNLNKIKTNENHHSPLVPRTCRATTRSPGWATLTKAQVRSSLLGESIFTPTTTVRPSEPPSSQVFCILFFFRWSRSEIKYYDVFLFCFVCVCEWTRLCDIAYRTQRFVSWTKVWFWSYHPMLQQQ